MNSYEAISSSDLAIQTEPGFAEKLVAKIIDNVQVSIKSIYIRYEDVLTSNFSIGVAIKEATVFTCNERWDREFITGQPLTYKLVYVDQFRVFLDYDNFEAAHSEDFIERSRAEICDCPGHRFVIVPLALTLQVIMNKDPQNLSIPQLSATLLTAQFNFSLETKQTTLALKFLELLSLFTKFQNGVMENMNEQELSGQEGAKYRELYKQWRILSSGKGSKKAQEVREELERCEYLCTLSSIIANRAAVNKEIEILSKEQIVREEMEKLENPERGTLSKISSFFGRGRGGGSKAEEEAKLKKLAEMEKDLKLILDQKNQHFSELETLVADTEVFRDNVPEDYVKFNVTIKVEGLSLCLKDEQRELVAYSMTSTVIEAGLRPTTVFVKLDIESSLISDCLQYSAQVPDIMVGKALLIEFDQLPSPRIFLKSEGVVLYVNLPALVNLANCFIPAVAGQVDWTHFLELADETTKEYIKSGHEYVEGLMQNGVQSAIRLNIDAKAPVIVVPVNLTEVENGLLVFDLGQFRASSGVSSENGVDYDRYEFILQNIQTLSIMNCPDVSDLDFGETKELVKPVNVSLSILNCREPALNIPAIIFHIVVTQIQLYVDEGALGFVITLMNNSLKETSKLKAVESNEQQVLLPPAEDEETEAYKDRIKTLSNIIALRLTVLFEQFSLVVSANNEEFAELQVDNLALTMKMDSDLTIKGKFRLTCIALEDKRASTALPHVLCNPFSLNISEYEFVDPQEDLSLIKATFTLLPKADAIEISASIKDIRLCPHPEFLSQLLEFFSSQMKSLEILAAPPAAEPKQEHHVASHYETTLLRKFSVTLSNFELWIPLDNTNPHSAVGSFNFGLCAQYISSQKFRKQFDKNGHNIGVQFLNVDDDGYIEISHIGIAVGEIEGNQIALPRGRQAPILEPSRVSANYLSKQQPESPAVTRIEANLESFSAAFWLSDLQFFRAASLRWAAIGTAVAEPGLLYEEANEQEEALGTTEITFECDALQISLQDDSDLHRLISANFSNVFGDCVLAKELKFQVEVYLMIDFYNEPKAVWEPLIENWNLNLAYLQGKTETQVNLVAPTTLNINLTHQMATVLGKLMTRLTEESKMIPRGDFVTKELNKEIQSHGALVYLVKNQLGVPLTLWLDSKNDPEKWGLGQDETKRITQTAMDKAFAYSSVTGSNKGVLGDVRAPVCIAFSVEDSVPVKGVSIESFRIVGVKLALRDREVECIVNIYPAKAERVVLIQSTILCYNCLSRPLHIELGSERLAIPMNSAVPIPLNWIVSEETPQVVDAEDSAGFFESSALRLGTEEYAVKSIRKYKTQNKTLQTVIAFTPNVTVSNYIPGILRVMNGQESLAVLYPGRTRDLLLLESLETSSLSFKVTVNEDSSIASDNVIIKEVKTTVNVEGDYPCSGIIIEKKEYRCKDLPELHLSSRTITENSKISAVQLEVYPQYIIVNRTEVAFECGKTTKLRIDGHSTGFFRSNKNKLKIRTAPETYGEASEWSPGFNIKTVSVSGLIELDTSKALDAPKAAQFGVAVISAPLPFPKSKILYLVPRYLITSHLPFPVKIRQEFSKQPGKRFSQLNPNSTLAYQLEDSRASKLVAISSTEDHWSSAFSIEELEDFQVKFSANEEEKREDSEWHQPNPTNNFMHIVRIIVATEDEATLHINLLSPNDPEYSIYNNSNKQITVRQGNCPELVVAPHSKAPWAFDNLQKEPRIKLQRGKHEKEYDISQIKRHGSLGKCLVDVVVSGVTRELRIYNKRANFLENKEEFGIHSVFSFSSVFRGIGVSIIDEKPIELFYLSLSELRLEAKITDASRDQQRKQKTQLDFQLQEFQLDNMCTKNKFFPLILARSGKLQDNTPFLQVKVHKTSTFRAGSPGEIESSSMDKFDWVEFLMQEMSVKVNQEILSQVTELVDKTLTAITPCAEYQEQLQTSTRLVDLHVQLDTCEPALSFNPTQGTKKAYFKAVRLWAMKIVLTFRTPLNSREFTIKRLDYALFRVFSALGTSLASISESPLFFSEIILMDSFQTYNTLSALLIKNYTRQGILQFYKIIGSSDLIGNPIGLIDKLGTGVFEFISEPSKGLLKGPKGFAEGISKGVRSLVGSVVAGGFGSVSKVTGSLYSIVRQVGGDEHAASRINQSDSALSKIASGFTGCGRDLVEGFTQVFTKPWKGAKKGGIKGFFKGAGSGLVGLVTAPIGAALRLGAGIASGIGEAGNLLAHGKISLRGRVRFPRYISEKGILEPYNDEIAQAQELLKQLRKNRREKIVFYLRLAGKEDIIVILTMKSLLFIVEGELKELLKVTEIDVCEVHRVNLKFYIEIEENNKKVTIATKAFHQLARLHFAVLVMSKRIDPVKRVLGILLPRRCC